METITELCIKKIVIVQSENKNLYYVMVTNSYDSFLKITTNYEVIFQSNNQQSCFQFVDDYLKEIKNEHK